MSTVVSLEIEPRVDSVLLLSPYQRLVTILGRAALEETDLVTFCQTVVDHIAVTFKVEYSRIWEVGSDRHSLRLVTDYGFNSQETVYDLSLELTSLSQCPLIIPDQSKTHGLPHPQDMVSGLSIPILDQDEFLGILELYTKVDRTFTLDEIHCLQSICHLLTTVITKKRIATLHNTQSRILEEVAVGENLFAIYNDLCLLIEQQLPNAYCSILIRDPQENRLRRGGAPSLPPEFAQGVDGLMIGECSGSCGTAAYRGESVFVNDIATNPLWAPFKDFALSYNIRACWSSPFLAKSGEVLGTFAISHSVVCEPTEYHLKLLKTATHLASIATENARHTIALEKEIQEKSIALRQLQEAQTQLVQTEKLSSLGQLVAGVAHEINNPTGCILGNLKPAQDYIQDLMDLIGVYQRYIPVDHPEVSQALEDYDFEFLRQDLPQLLRSMEDSAKRIKEISLSMRTFVRSDSSQKVSFNVHEGLESTLLILKHRLKEQGGRPAISVVRQYGEIPVIYCFPGQLNQVFMNLFANSIDSIESKGFLSPHQITVTTCLSSDKRSVVITIQDTGKGMSDEVKSHLFEYLYTTKEVGKGTGLGLSIARQIIQEKHGGKISCISQLNEGTTFTIALPIH